MSHTCQQTKKRTGRERERCLVKALHSQCIWLCTHCLLRWMKRIELSYVFPAGSTILGRQRLMRAREELEQFHLLLQWCFPVSPFSTVWVCRCVHPHPHPHPHVRWHSHYVTVGEFKSFHCSYIQLAQEGGSIPLVSRSSKWDTGPKEPKWSLAALCFNSLWLFATAHPHPPTLIARQMMQLVSALQFESVKVTRASLTLT